MQLKIWPKEILQEANVEEIPTNAVMLGDWVPELHLIVVRRPINSLVIKEMRKIIIQEIHQLFHVNR